MKDQEHLYLLSANYYMPGTVLTVLYGLFHLILARAQWDSSSIICIS